MTNEEELDEVSRYIGEGLLRWRIPVSQYKEKYGTVRVYCRLGWTSIHDVTHPGYAYIQYRPGSFLWHWNYSWRINRIIFGLVGLIVNPIHRQVYRWYYKNAVARWPHLRKSILLCADCPEYLVDLLDE